MSLARSWEHLNRTSPQTRKAIAVCERCEQRPARLLLAKGIDVCADCAQQSEDVAREYGPSDTRGDSDAR